MNECCKEVLQKELCKLEKELEESRQREKLDNAKIETEKSIQRELMDKIIHIKSAINNV